MKPWLACLLALFALAPRGGAHRLDEYLQAALVSLESGRLRVSLRLIPGVAVSSSVIAAADADRDGSFSSAEQSSYAQTVLRDLSLRLDGRALSPRVESIRFPMPSELRTGLGEIRIELTAALPGAGARRSLSVENRHWPARSVYLMNCLSPRDPSITVLAQIRNPDQSSYRIDYTQSSELRRALAFPSSWSFAPVPRMFRLGVHHIAGGTDHLLFLITLLLPAPLIAAGSRWSSCAGVRQSLVQIFRVVSAFTVGHSLTLALAGFGIVSLPSRPVESLIAVSILVSAIHAWRPIFPRREPVVAAFFGLIHGLAFAATLQDLGVGRWQRVANILGFNLGIEAMQLVVVAAILPSLLLLSRNRQYALLRCTGAATAGATSLAWMVERLWGISTSVDLVVDRLAQHGLSIAAALLALSVLSGLQAAVSGRADRRDRDRAGRVLPSGGIALHVPPPAARSWEVARRSESTSPAPPALL